MPINEASKQPLPFELIDWPRRLAREQTLLGRLVAEAPSRRVLDLGCGTGQHARLLAGHGCEVTAIDGSEAALERALEGIVPEGVEFVLGEIGAIERSVRGHFGAAICLGNTLPHILSPESLSRLFIGLKRRLLPGGRVLIQLLNYDPIRTGGRRALPTEIVPFENDELAVVRLAEPRDDGIVLHTTAVLRYDPAGRQPVELLDTRRAQLRGWTSEELGALLDVARLEVEATFGDMSGSDYDPHNSPELVLAVRSR